MVDDLPAAEEQIYPLGHDAAGPQNVGVERAIEGEHQALTGFLENRAVGQPHVGQQFASVVALPFIFGELGWAGTPKMAPGLDAPHNSKGDSSPAPAT
ncbi:MAG: hypothetical protein AAF911_10960 [Planctomycetota bacterium]